MGTGYQVLHWQRGHSIHLSKAEGFRHANQVRMAQARFRFLHEPVAQSAALQAGEIDVAFNFATQAVQRFRTTVITRC